MSSAPAGTAPTTGRQFSIRLPANWYEIGLADDASFDASVDRLLGPVVAGTDPELVAERFSLRRRLAKARFDANRQGAALLAFCFDPIEGIPLVASIIVVPGAAPRDGSGISALTTEREKLVARLPEHDELLASSEVDLPAGRAARIVRRTRPVRSGASGDLRQVAASYLLQSPGGVQLIVHLATPVLPLEDAFIELFDAIAASVSWVG